MRQVCGALSGMFMVLGVLYGYDDAKNDTAKKELYTRVQSLAEKFKDKHGSIICRELLGVGGAQKPEPSRRTAEFYKTRPCVEFVIDAACFPGSSGSPVFLYNNRSYRDKVNHGIVLGSRLYFLGILYGGPSSLIRSKIATGGVTPISKSIEMTTNIPNNLGYVIKAEIMNDFIPLVETQTHSKIKKI